MTVHDSHTSHYMADNIIKLYQGVWTEIEIVNTEILI